MSVKSKGYWVNIEGLDGSGKSSFIDLLSEELDIQLEDHDLGVDIVPDIIVIKGLGEGDLGEPIRNAIMDEYIKPDEPMYHTAMLTSVLDCHKAARDIINEGSIAISDRYLGSFYAYNCCASDSIVAKKLMEIVYDGLDDGTIIMPNLELYMDVEVQTAVSRLAMRDDKDPLDKKGFAYYSAVKNAYEGWYRKHAIWKQTKTVRVTNESGLDHMTEQARLLAEQIVNDILTRR